MEEIARALADNAKQSDVVANSIEQLTGKLATTAAKAKQAERDKKRDDELVADQPEAQLAAARESYPALNERLGTNRPTRQRTAPRPRTAFPRIFINVSTDLTRNLAALRRA